MQAFSGSASDEAPHAVCEILHEISRGIPVVLDRLCAVIVRRDVVCACSRTFSLRGMLTCKRTASSHARDALWLQASV